MYQSQREATPARRIEGLTREEACVRFLPRVRAIARRLHERLSGEARLPLEDLAAVGTIGLLEAFDRFDPARTIAFATYAEYRIRGAMYDSLREHDAFSRRRRQLARDLQLEGDRIRRAEGRAPRPVEVAEALGLPLDAFHEAVDRTKPVVHVPLDAPARADGPAEGDRLPDPAHGVVARMVAREVRAALADEIRELPERQRTSVLLYYRDERTLAEIAAGLGVTVSRVSQILTDARGRLRRRLALAFDREDLAAPG